MQSFLAETPCFLAVKRKLRMNLNRLIREAGIDFQSNPLRSFVIGTVALFFE